MKTLNSNQFCLELLRTLLKMFYFKISLLSSLLVVLAAVNAQDYFFESFESEPNVRTPNQLGDYILQRTNGEHLRYRRQADDDGSRHRRQGAHGGGHGGHGGHEGVTGPVHTFVKTDEHAHFKWGVRHHVGHEYAGRR